MKDFPNINLKQFGIKAQHPDNFLLNLLRKHRKAFCHFFKNARLQYTNPQLTPKEYLDKLEKLNLKESILQLKKLLHLI